MSTTILFVTQRLSDFVEMRRAAMSLKRNYGHRCIILYCTVGSEPEDKAVIAAIERSISAQEIDEKIIFSGSALSRFVHYLNRFLTQKAASSPVASEKKQLSFKKRMWVRLVIFRFHVQSFWQKLIKFLQASTLVLMYRDNLSIYKAFVKEYGVNLIILPEDIVGAVSPLLIKAGHFFRIPSIILPYTIANQTEAFQALKARREYSLRSLNRILGTLFPAWVMRKESYALLRLPSAHVLGHIITRSSPPDPWMMNSTYANVIAVENQEMFNYYLRYGIPASKMKITGACYEDDLARFVLDKETQREKLYAELNIKTDKPLLLIAGFPNQLLGKAAPGFDFANVEEAVDFIATLLAYFGKDYEILFRPHPNYLALADLFAKKNIRITQIDTARLVALADVYLAFASATIRWAIACGVPTINYDIFNYQFSDYQHVKGVLTVGTQADFKTALKTITTPESYALLKTYLEVEKYQWGNLDGQALVRINALMLQLIGAKKIRRRAY